LLGFAANTWATDLSCEGKLGWVRRNRMEEELVCLLVIREIESQILEIFESSFKRLPFWLSRTGLFCSGNSFDKIMDSKIIF